MGFSVTRYDLGSAKLKSIDICISRNVEQSRTIGRVPTICVDELGEPFLRDYLQNGQEITDARKRSLPHLWNSRSPMIFCLCHPGRWVLLYQHEARLGHRSPGHYSARYCFNYRICSREHRIGCNCEKPFMVHDILLLASYSFSTALFVKLHRL